MTCSQCKDTGMIRETRRVLYERSTEIAEACRCEAGRAISAPAPPQPSSDDLLYPRKEA